MAKLTIEKLNEGLEFAFKQRIKKETLAYEAEQKAIKNFLLMAETINPYKPGKRVKDRFDTDGKYTGLIVHSKPAHNTCRNEITFTICILSDRTKNYETADSSKVVLEN